MKRLFTVIMLISFICLFADEFHGIAIGDDVLKMRKQQAVEIVSSDEGFLEEHYYDLSRHDILYFFVLAYEKAENIAEDTILIFIDEDAYLFMLDKIDGKDGLKQEIEEKVKLYLEGNYEPNEVDINKYYEAHRFLSIKENRMTSN